MVTAILGLIAYMALDTVAQDTSSVRFEDTRTRLTAIRTSVLGRPATGQSPATAGFIADMGRVPKCPQELMTDQSLALPTSCTTGVALETWQLDSVTSDPSLPPVGTGLGYGWRGPYLHAFRETTLPCPTLATTPATITTCSVTGDRPVALRDGWGNMALGRTYDGTTISDPNYDLFGWRFFGPDTSGNLYVQSYGSDGKDGDSANIGMYANDYPPAATANTGDPPDALVMTQEYQIDLQRQQYLKVRLVNATSAAMNFDAGTAVCASLHYVAKNTSTNQTWIATLYTLAAALPDTNLPEGDSWSIDLPLPIILSTSSTQGWLPTGPMALRLHGTTTPATCGTSGTPSATIDLLKHTYFDPTNPAAPVGMPDPCRRKAGSPAVSDPANTSPGRACGTTIFTALPPNLPQKSIDVTLWP